MITKKESSCHSPDYFLIFGLFFLLIIGLFMLTSASYFIGCQKLGDCYFYLKHQLLYGLLPGLFLFLLLSRIDYRRLKKWTLVFLGGAILLLVLMLFPQFGSEVGGSQRWLNIFGFTFQPSEIVKLAFLFFLSAWLSKKQTNLRSWGQVFLPFLFFLALISALILFQKDLSTLLIIISSSLVVYFLAGAPWKHLLILFLLLGTLFLISTRYVDYRTTRILVFLGSSEVSEESRYHLDQALRAVSSGGFFGAGLGRSAQKFYRLPEVIGDSIFAVTAEELGFLMTFLLLLLYLFVFYRIFKIASLASDKFGQLLAAGIGFWFILQTFINMGGMLNLIPITGVPLPFMSYGSSSLVIFFVSFGILVAISKQTKVC
jgi:cell division protein FtsW